MAKDSKKSQSKITPLADRVLIREEIENHAKTDSGIFIPETVDHDKGAKKGKVIAVGAGKYEDGKLVPVSVKEGDTVLFQWGDKISINNEEFYLVRESELIAVVK